MTKEQSSLEATQEKLLAPAEAEVIDLGEPTQAPEFPLSPKLKAEEEPVPPEATVKKVESRPEPEVVEPKTPEETVSPKIQEDAVESFNRRTNERLASLTVTPEADKTERAELEKLMAEKDKIGTAMARSEALEQEIEDINQTLKELEPLRTVTVGEEEIKPMGTKIRKLDEEKKRLKRELEAARKEKEAWIGTPERASQTQNTYEGLEMAISEEEERLLKQNEAQREQYGEEKQAAKEAKQRLAVWQNYLENETEIKEKEGEYENRIKVLSEERERASTEEEKALYAKRIAVWRGQLTRLRKKIPPDIDGFEGEPKNEIEGMYRETVREMRGEEVERSQEEEEKKEGEIPATVTQSPIPPKHDFGEIGDKAREGMERLLKIRGLSDEQIQRGLNKERGAEEEPIEVVEGVVATPAPAETTPPVTEEETGERILSRRERKLWGEEPNIEDSEAAREKALGDWQKERVREQERGSEAPLCMWGLTLLLINKRISPEDLNEREKALLRMFKAEDLLGEQIKGSLAKVRRGAEEKAEKVKEKSKEEAVNLLKKVQAGVQGVVDIWKEMPGLWRRDKKLALKAVLTGGVSGAGFGLAGGVVVGASSVALAGTPLAAVAVGAGISIGVGYVKIRFDRWWLETHMKKTFFQIGEQLGKQLEQEGKSKGEIETRIAARIEADRKGYMANFISAQVIGGIAGGLIGKDLGKRAVESLISKEPVAPVIVKEREIGVSVKPEVEAEVKPKVVSKPRPTIKAPAEKVTTPRVTPRVTEVTAPTEVAAPVEVNIETLLNTELKGDTLWGSLEGAVEKVVEASPRDQFISSTFETGVTNRQWTTDAICDIITRNGASIPDWQGKTIAQLLERDPEFLRFISRGLTTKNPKKLLELYLEFKKFKARLGI